MDWKAFWKKFCFPPVWLVLLLVVLTAAGLTVVFAKDLTEHPAAYALYAVAFYTLCVVTVFCAVVLPKRYQSIRNKIDSHPVGHRYMTDPAFRTHVKLYTALTVNLLYVGVNVLSWFLYRSMWFVVLAVYYVILAVMRFLLLWYVRGNAIGKHYFGELRRAGLCAYILLLLNVVLTGAVMMILYQNKGVQYHGVLIYVMASYTFYSTIRAVIDLVKYQKHRSPVMTMTKIIALSAALVSMLNLETAMFSQFGAEMAQKDQRLMIALTGAGVSAAVIAMSVYMIIRTARERKEPEKHGRA